MSEDQFLGKAVDVALVLAADVSSSVDEGDYKLQMRGIAAALRNPMLGPAIAVGAHQRIALSIIHFSTRQHQEVVLPWRAIATSQDLEETARIVEGLERKWTPGGTGLGAAISVAAGYVLALKVKATGRIVDVSGDGEDNEQDDVGFARDEAVNMGVTINGLPITWGSPTLVDYYTRFVMGGPNSFIMPARDLRDFKDAMAQKLMREVGAQIS
jgi:Protein of unknown function (DUF1194)